MAISGTEGGIMTSGKGNNAFGEIHRRFVPKQLVKSVCPSDAFLLVSFMGATPLRTAEACCAL
jgi:hypothetical protein